MAYSVKTKSMIVTSVVDDSVRIIFNSRIKSLYVGDSIRTINEKKQGVVAQVYKIENFINDKNMGNLQSVEESISELSLDGKDALHVAFCKIKFSIIENKWVQWKGNLPSITDQVDLVYNSELISHIIGSKPLNPINLGSIPDNNALPFELEASLLEKTTLVIGNKTNDKLNLITNLQRELLNKQAKTLIIDPKGYYSNLKTATILEAGKNFKLSIKGYGLSNLVNLVLSQVEPALKVRLENYLSHIVHNAMSVSKGFLSLELIKNAMEQEQNKAENQQMYSEINLLRNRIVNIDKLGIFANNKEEVISLKTYLNEFNSIVLNISNLPLYWQKVFLRNILKDLASYEICTFVFYEDIHKYIDHELALEILYKIPGLNNFFITNYDADIPLEIYKESDNFFLFKTTKLELNSSLHNNLKIDNELLSHLLKLLAENNIVIYGELTIYYPLMLELFNNYKAFCKNKHFGFISKHISENGDVIYSYKDKEDQRQLKQISPEINFVSFKEPVNYIKQDASIIETFKEISKEYEQEEFLEDDDFKNLYIEEGIEETEKIEEVEEIEEEKEEIEAEIEEKIDEIHQNIEIIEEDFEEIEENVEEIEEKVDEIQEDVEIIEEDFEEIIEDFEEIEEEPAEIEEPLEEQIIQEEFEVLEHVEDIETQEESIYIEPIEVVSEETPKEKIITEKIPEEKHLRYQKEISLPEHLENIPVYSTSDFDNEQISFNEGDNVYHERYGYGVINRIISTGEKKLCSIQFENFGRRLLDPNRGLQKVEE